MAIRDLTDDPESALADAANAVLAPLFGALPPDDAASPPAKTVVLRNRRARALARLVAALVSRQVPEVSDALRESLGVLVTRWHARQWDDAFQEVEDFELRCAEESEVLVARAVADEAEALAAAERLHRQRVIHEHGRIELRGLQASARVYQRLDDVWIPLHVHDPERAQEIPDGALPDGAAEVLRLASQFAQQHARYEVDEALARHPRAILEGGAGSGKSTLVSFLASRAAADDAGALPVVVTVRSMPRVALDLATIAETSGCDRALLEDALRRGRALLLVDGLDEAPGGRDALVPALRALAEEFPAARVWVTTRPGAAGASDLLTIEGFASLRLLPMTREESATFVDRWCLAAERSLQKSGARAEEDARVAADDLKGRIRRSRAIAQLAETPLLCSVLCVVHRFRGQRIPERRAGLYEACADVLLYEWDQAKLRDGASPTLMGALDAQSKRALLATLARDLHDRHVAEATDDDVLRVFASKLPELGVSPDNAARMLEEIRDRSGMLMERRPKVFGFSHLGFQEYLTAHEYVHAGDCERLVARCADPWWHEVIALSAGFNGAPTAKMVRALLDVDPEGEVGTGTMLAAWCEETAVELPVSLRKEIEARISMLLSLEPKELRSKLEMLRDVATPVLCRKVVQTTGDAQIRVVLALAQVDQEAVAAFLPLLIRNAKTYSPIKVDDVQLGAVPKMHLTVAGATILPLLAIDGLSAVIAATIDEQPEALSDDVCLVLYLLGLAHFNYQGPNTDKDIESARGLFRLQENVRKMLSRLSRGTAEQLLARGGAVIARLTATAPDMPSPPR